MTSHHRESPGAEFEVRCPLSGSALRIIRAFVEIVACHAGFDGESVAQIEMAVDEACSNVWLHAYPEAGGGNGDLIGEGAEGCEVTLRIHIDPHAMSISIIDRGIGDLKGPHEGIRTVEEYCERSGGYHGLGTFIMRSFMDEVEYHYPEEKGTVVRMKKYLRSEVENR
jgi:serine/threonine-protein kinase RsbW